jgi:uncharacterized membrane protein
MFGLLLATALGCGLIGGAFFVFSVMVMPALNDLPPDQGIAAMQSINRIAVKPGFMLAFAGTALLCVAVAVMAIIRWDEPGSVAALIASGIYLVGTFIFTIAFHVPRNDKLDTLDPDASSSHSYWVKYMTEWTIGNHLRGAAAIGALVLLIFAFAAVRSGDDSDAGAAAWPQPDPYGRVMISSK